MDVGPVGPVAGAGDLAVQVEEAHVGGGGAVDPVVAVHGAAVQHLHQQLPGSRLIEYGPGHGRLPQDIIADCVGLLLLALQFQLARFLLPVFQRRLGRLELHRAAIGHGASYGVVLPGTDPLTGDKMALMRGKSSKRMAAFYDDEDDEWCLFALEGVYQPALQSNDETGWYIRFYDETAVHYLWARGEGLDLADWEYISYEPHPFRVPPVARCVNRIDTEGNTIGEIAPVIPLLQSIDQDKFDRLIVQRFGAWKVRYIAGMARPTDQQQAAYQAMKLKIEDLLISTNKDTKFGTLDATDLKGFIEAHDADLRVLSAITQTPPHHLLGLSSNLQAEALAAAESGLQRKSGDFRTGAGEFHEQMARLVSIADGNLEEARMHNAQVRWRDTESRSMTQAADALFKLAEGLHVPVEMLWERIPGWTDSDTERAKSLIESGDSIDQILQALAEINEQAENDAAGEQGGAPGGDQA